MAKYYDTKRKEQKFIVDELVMLDTKNLNTPHLGHQDAKRKIMPRWLGPFKIVALTSIDSYEIQLPLGVRLHPVFHTSLLKPFQKDSNSARIQRTKEVILPDGATGYLIDKIIGYKTIKGIEYYKIRWQGYTAKDDTWEPWSNIQTVAEYHRDQYWLHKRRTQTKN